MTDHVTDIILPVIRKIDQEINRVLDEVCDLKVRMTSLGQRVGLVHGDFANQCSRMDRMEQRLDRIERRLELADAPAE